MSRTRHHGVNRRPFSSPRCGRRRGYYAKRESVMRHWDDSLDLGHRCGKAMRLTRDWMVRRDFELYRAGELDCLGALWCSGNTRRFERRVLGSIPSGAASPICP